MKLVITVIWTTVAFLALATFATAAPPEQAKGPQAKLSITPKRVDAGERFTLNARGFTPNASVVVTFAITGEAPYSTYTPPTSTLADGTYSLPFVYAECRHNLDGTDVSVDLTITLVDSSGVHASAALTLC